MLEHQNKSGSDAGALPKGNDADALYTTIWPEYIATQKQDLWHYERLWAVLLRQLERRTPKSDTKKHLIEFGSGPGFLLQLAWRRGWWAFGVEPSAVARAHASSLGYPSNERSPWWLGDAAIATEVLEHVEEPVAELVKWREAMRGVGLLALSVPNDNNPLQRLFWGRKKPWVHHTHLHYFNRRSLRAVLEEAGFEVVWERTSFPVELLLILPIPRKWAWKLSRLWPAPPFLWRLRIGRHLLMVAKKV